MSSLVLLLVLFFLGCCSCWLLAVVGVLCICWLLLVIVVFVVAVGVAVVGVDCC